MIYYRTQTNWKQNKTAAVRPLISHLTNLQRRGRHAEEARGNSLVAFSKGLIPKKSPVKKSSSTQCWHRLPFRGLPMCVDRWKRMALEILRESMMSARLHENDGRYHLRNYDSIIETDHWIGWKDVKFYISTKRNLFGVSSWCNS